MKESQEKCVEVKDANQVVVREMLRYFYTGKIENLKDICTDLYELADRYMVDRLKAFCTLSLVEGVNMDNALEMYCFGRVKEIPSLVENAKRILIL